MSDSPPHGQGLVLRLLGEIEVEKDGTALALPPSKKTRALLAYLAVVRRPQRRDRLCAMFWEIPDDPRGALRWSLSKLRALLDRPGGYAAMLGALVVKAVAGHHGGDATFESIDHGSRLTMLVMRRL